MRRGATGVLGVLLAAAVCTGLSFGEPTEVPAPPVPPGAPDTVSSRAAELMRRADLPTLALPDTVRIQARREWRPRPQVSLLYESVRPTLPSPGLLKVPNPASIPARPPLVELSRFGRIAYAADAGAYAGLSLGVLGNWCGLWEERKAWALMGAGAAVGAILGAATGSENSRVRIGVTADRDRP